MNYIKQMALPFFIGLTSSAFLWLLQAVPKWYIFFPVLVVWLGFLFLAHKFVRPDLERAQQVLPLSIFTAISFVGLLTLVVGSFLYWFLIILVGLMMLLLYRYPLGRGYIPSVEQKPFRRMMMVLWVFDTYAITTTLFAIGLFFTTIPFWLVALVAGFVFGGSSFMIWRMYLQLTLHKNWFWVLLVAVVMFELVWVIHILPFGHFAAGFLVTWLWYLLQLLIRFHFSPRGVIWKKQAAFLISNVVIYLLILIFFVRWV